MSPESLNQISFFKPCSDSFKQIISGHALTQEHPKGKILFLSGDTAERFYLVKSGWVKLFRETLDGTQAIVDILPANHIFGDTAIFDDNTYPYSAEIVEPAKIVSFPIHDLKTEIENNNKMAISLLSSMARYRRQQDREIEHMSIQNAPQRIGCFLLRLAPQDAKKDIQIRLPYDKTLVASRLGMQPETFSRALAKLRERTGIRVNGSVIELDSLNQLVEFSCAACSSEFPCKDLPH